MNSFKELSETEMEILQVLWASEEPRSSGWLLNYFNDVQNRDWKKQTLSTYLLRMGEKGVISSKRAGRTFEHTALMSKEEYEQKKAKNILTKMYEGSIFNFVNALYNGEKIDQSEVEDLKKWLDSQQEEG